MPAGGLCCMSYPALSPLVCFLYLYCLLSNKGKKYKTIHENLENLFFSPDCNDMNFNLLCFRLNLHLNSNICWTKRNPNIIWCNNNKKKTYLSIKCDGSDRRLTHTYFDTHCEWQWCTFWGHQPSLHWSGLAASSPPNQSCPLIQHHGKNVCIYWGMFVVAGYIQ